MHNRRQEITIYTPIIIKTARKLRRMIYHRNLLNQAFIWLKRFRHRKGYGVQSPLVFHFIREVILQSTPYYEYEQLKKLYRKIQIQEQAWMLPRKRYELLFRIANEIKPDEIIEIGTKVALGIIYSSAARKKAQCHIWNERPIQNETIHHLLNHSFISYKQGDLEHFILERLSTDTHKKRMIIYNCELFPDSQNIRQIELLIKKSQKNDCIILSGLQRSKTIRTHWKKWITASPIGISFDLYEAGILFFKPYAQQKCYLINY